MEALKNKAPPEWGFVFDIFLKIYFQLTTESENSQQGAIGGKFRTSSSSTRAIEELKLSGESLETTPVTSSASATRSPARMLAMNADPQRYIRSGGPNQ